MAQRNTTRGSAQTVRAAITASICLAAAYCLSAPAAWAGDLLVRYDQSQLIRLPRPASEIIVGNPSIADVSIQGGNLIAVTGKSFGVTNIIALDAQRNIIQDQRVIVQRDEQRMVVVYRGPSRESYTCTPYCTPTVTVGDEPKFFDSVAKSAQTKATMSSGVAGPARTPEAQ